MVRSYHRLFRSLSSHGLSGTLDRAFCNAPTLAQTQDPKPPHPFDLLHGTVTDGYISGTDIPGVSLSALYVTAYIGIAPSVLTQAISALPLKPEDFTFVDLGCGKGRALMVASQFPFRHLLGVELAADLCGAAWTNVASSPDWSSQITVLNQDATTVTYPDGPLLVFLFHPFLAPVLRRVLDNLERQLRRSPRETYLLYGRDPHYTKVLRRFPFLREISEISYPLSPEDAAVDYFQLTQESFTLYSADVNR